MWTVLILLICCGLRFSVSTSPPSPLNVSFSSVNLRNVLHWLPGINTPDDTIFIVEYAIYGDSIQGHKGRRVNWRAVQKCKEIVRTWCDLSRETEDEEQGYHARVRAVTAGASSKWALTRRRFDPKVDTSFGPPVVSVEIENNSAIITLRGPMRYPTKNHSSVLSLAAIYPQMTYILSINNTYRNQVHHIPVVASPHKHQLLDYNTQYCFSARSRFLSLPIQCQPSAWHCIITPQDPLVEQLRTVVVGIVVPGLCFGMIAVAGYLLHQYLTGKGHKRPYILNSSYFRTIPETFPPENPSHIISVIRKEPPSDPISTVSDPESSRGQQGISGPPPIYSPQGPGAHPEEVWDDLSVDYGFVSAAPKIIDEEDEGERRLDEGTAGTCAAGGSQPRSWSGVVGGHSSGDSAPPQRSHRTQNMSQTCRKTHVPVDTQTEVNTCDRVSVSSQINSTSLAQTQVASRAFQGSTDQVSKKEEEEEEEEEEEKALPGLLSKENVDEDERHEPESIPLLSAYASQNIQNTSTSTPAHSDYLQDDYATLAGATQETEEDDYDCGDEEEGERVCVVYDPETRKLVLPAFGQQKREDFLRLSEERKNSCIGGEDEEETYVTKGELRLENVFVRQGSEEEALQGGGGTGCEVDELLSEWDLQISMGE